jgi:hypothetical protein
MYDESKHLQVESNAVAVSNIGSVTGLDWFGAVAGIFDAVPPHKTLTITDVLLTPYGNVTAAHVVNLAEKSSGGAIRIFFQFYVPPGATQQAHFLTGHVIESGSQVVTFTAATPPFGEHIAIYLNGYLPK